ncbi:YvcK family protein [Patescibacteria group bacterium]|nr:YvcK family protein [Patescibacteria group bacterium]MBU4141614.1 YvcK family protein [Patescibacteria group bacterium]MBU4338255.1 YvcK family protein [Patescibacteria group bacterium]MBU4580349.1 YvcK family protein [Patescibacteria group bacterium]
MAKKNIVIIGGGTASAWLLGGLKRYIDKYNLTVVGSMADNGGSNGRLQEGLGVAGLGALRKCLLALSEADNDIKNTFAYRFEKSELDGHVAGNIFMAALEKTSGSAESALAKIHKILKVNGKVVPASLDKTTLFAELENGEIVEGETNIDIPKHDGKIKIKKIFLKPVPEANSEAILEIGKADLIIIGPGDLYSTVLPNFLAPRIAEAAKKSKSKKIFIVNSLNKFGETNDFSVEDFVDEAEKYLGARIDFAIYNSGIFPEKKLSEYKKTKPMAADLVKAGKDLDKNKFIGKNLLLKGKADMDAEKLIRAILDIGF